MAGDTMDSRLCRSVTAGVIAYNECKYLPELLSDLLHQTYPLELTEVVLVDSGSEDETKELMNQFRKEHLSEYADICVLDNPNRTQPAGWNVVLSKATSDVIIRIDAHARLPEDFIEKNMICINAGESVCGGPRENIIDEDTEWKQMLLEAEQSMFGSGIAAYRNETVGRKYVKSVFHAAYRKEVFDTVGLFNEELIRTEDNEMHYRIREAGYKICYDPGIRSYYQTRNTLGRMIRQKYQNGLWIGKTLFVCPGCISLFHLVPFMFVLAIIFTSLLLCFGISWLAIMLWSAYGLVNILMVLTAIFSAKKKGIAYFVLPVVFLLLHLAYGFGTMTGIFSHFIKR